MEHPQRNDILPRGVLAFNQINLDFKIKKLKSVDENLVIVGDKNYGVRVSDREFALVSEGEEIIIN